MHSLMFATLDLALADIADRSFDEDATITPTAEGYEVADDFCTVFPDGHVMWTHADGAALPDNASDHSRVHETYESYTRAGHIRYNLPEAVEALAEGKPVTFAYVEAISYPETAEDIADAEAGLYDGTVGWMLIAHIHTDA